MGPRVMQTTVPVIETGLPYSGQLLPATFSETSSEIFAALTIATNRSVALDERQANSLHCKWKTPGQAWGPLLQPRLAVACS